ncbi:hypothetical protein CEUSTIGMA_g9988.t1 [Chlamydomonas eustigma]|uniref:Uncharacterized protein n=1 Tax=Chlamydomonas eustigma TaxID=1157962 RepID=A0A250XI23_9CHLO|nr:hypothetical protein CEUSTIGMA_g9988.t1 [Chlamydomonas eustigma]|eukprot:GAX82562.1 hypothetical protein CEUSTIGMA_g9988.t1 [Chlamydomonas eustigma]
MKNSIQESEKLHNSQTDTSLKRRRNKQLSTVSCEGKESKETSSSWPYPTDYLDHFETSRHALTDIEPALYRLATHLGKKKCELVVYDPYFCKGGIRQHYKDALGINNFLHEKRDFYADIKNNVVPEYDILVTNPPYSADHKERILDFCAKSGKPWALLLPNYVVNKQYFQQATAAASDAVSTSSTVSPIFVVPGEKYLYEHPEGTGHEASPFFSIWIMHLGSSTNQVAHWWQKKLDKDLSHPARGGQEQGQLKISRSVDHLRESQAVPSWKRPNPKQRKKLKMLKEST